MVRKSVFVVGCFGKMGEIVCKLILKSEDFCLRYGCDYNQNERTATFAYSSETSGLDCGFGPTLSIPDPVDVVIDFSRPKATMTILPMAVERQIPMVIATTGFSPEQEAKIEEAGKTIPIFWSSNMAYSIKAFIETTKAVAKTLPDYQIAIHERHHAAKQDAPSGTAKMLFNAINEAHGGTLCYQYDENAPRVDNAVWLSAERNGNIKGEHRITFSGKNETIELKHSVDDRAVFADGALQAARFILKQTEPRIYTMDDLFNE